MGLWTWIGGSWSSAFTDSKWEALTLQTGDTQTTHSRTDLGWHIALRARHATSSIDLSYLPLPSSSAEQSLLPSENASRAIESVAHGAQELSHQLFALPANDALAGNQSLLNFKLREPHYRQTEQTWAEAGKPSANITIAVVNNALEIAITAFTGEIVVPREHEENLLDNERADVNSDGVELFIAPRASDPWTASWLVSSGFIHNRACRDAQRRESP